MKEVLDKVRLEYRDDYERFINKMERETDEVRLWVLVMVEMRECLVVSAPELYFLPDVCPAGEDCRCRPLLRLAAAGEDSQLPGQDLRPPGGP